MKLLDLILMLGLDMDKEGNVTGKLSNEDRVLDIVYKDDDIAINAAVEDIKFNYSTNELILE